MKIISTIKEIHDCCVERDKWSGWHAGSHKPKPNSWNEFWNDRGVTPEPFQDSQGEVEMIVTKGEAMRLGLIPCGPATCSC